MASLQAYQSHGRRYYRIVESFRQDGKPRIRVLKHLGRADDILRLVENQQTEIKVHSVSAGAVTALYHLAEELDVAGRINRAVQQANGRVQQRDALTVGETLLTGILGRACAPRSKRAFLGWAQSTHLPELMGFAAPKLTSGHFWEQMHAVPVKQLAEIEQELVREVIRIEQLAVQALAYDTTNFYTHIATTNTRPQLPQRGQNKQKRRDLRQLGLALVVDQTTQLPLAHSLYEGARSDMKTFAEFLKPIRPRLRGLTAQPQQLTLVFDAGSSSQENLNSLDPVEDRYVTAVRPSDHKNLLAMAAEQLTEVTLPNETVVRAWRTRRVIVGQERDTVVLFSAELYDGQLRGLHQYLDRQAKELEKMGLEPKTTVEAAQRKLAKMCSRQYLRTVARYEVTAEDGATRVRVWSDLDEYYRLTTRYFGLRILITDRSEWSTAQIITAYRGLSKVEDAFRNLKDPGMFSTRPQFHWTDQKLHVHAFMCVTGYLLVRLLWWRARRDPSFTGSPRGLLSELAQIRSCRIVECTGRPGRPRVRRQLEEMPDDLHRLGEHLDALPVLR